MDRMDTIEIPKDEYIELLRCKAATAGTAEERKPVRNGLPHSWLNQSEKAEIIRLHDLGCRVGEISQTLERPYSTVRRVIKHHLKTPEHGQ